MHNTNSLIQLFRDLGRIITHMIKILLKGKQRLYYINQNGYNTFIKVLIRIFKIKS